MSVYQYFWGKKKLIKRIFGLKVFDQKYFDWKNFYPKIKGQNKTKYTMDPGIYFLMKTNKEEITIKVLKIA